MRERNRRLALTLDCCIRHLADNGSAAPPPPDGHRGANPNWTRHKTQPPCRRQEHRFPARGSRRRAQCSRGGRWAMDRKHLQNSSHFQRRENDRIRQIGGFPFLLPPPPHSYHRPFSFSRRGFRKKQRAGEAGSGKWQHRGASQAPQMSAAGGLRGSHSRRSPPVPNYLRFNRTISRFIPKLSIISILLPKLLTVLLNSAATAFAL